MNLLVVGGQLDRCESNMLSEFARSGMHITTILEPKQTYGAIMQAAGIEHIPYTIKGRINPAAILFLRPFFKDKRFDIVHCFSSNALGNVLIASAGSGVKRIAYRGTSGHMSRLDPSSWITYLNPGLHKIVCVSHAVERYFQERVAPEKLITIHKGHNVEWYSGTSEVELSTFGIPPRSFVVSCVANMRPVKGVDFLINALRYIPPELPIHLLLIGDVRDNKVLALKDDPAFHGRLHFSGFRSDAPAIVGKTDCFVMPSIEREGLPKALIEAMAKKIPPIVTDVGGMPEVVRDGIEGFVVPPSDAMALAEAIVRMYQSLDQRRQFSEASYQRIVNEFNIQQTIEKTFALYQSLLSTKNL